MFVVLDSLILLLSMHSVRIVLDVVYAKPVVVGVYRCGGKMRHIVDMIVPASIFKGFLKP